MKRDARPEQLRLLNRWQAKACCACTQYPAYQRWGQLLPYLTSYEQSLLSTAWAYQESPEELNDTIGRLRGAWAKGREISNATDWLILARPGPVGRSLPVERPLTSRKRATHAC